jgi:O-succinylhomoserine sulfhydrylase
MTSKQVQDFSECSEETQLVHAGTLRSQFGEVSEAVFLNSGFCYDSAETAESRFNGVAPGFVYSRYRNPNLAMLEDRLALLEGAEGCISTGSGMAAVHASMMCFLKTGDHVVANRVLFGSCHYIITQILPRFGITYELVDGRDNAAWGKALSKKTAAVFIESPANPNLELVDIKHVCAIAKKSDAKVIIDNVFAGPLSQRPLQMGADVVVYSTTKYMDGQGRTLGGAILGGKSYIEDVLMPYFRHTGPALSPFNAWVILKGLETLSLRTERHVANAQKVAEFLEAHPKVAKIAYPGLKSFPQYTLAQSQMKHFGAMIAFEVKGGKAAAFALMNALKLVLISNNLGDSKSLITHPASTTHSNLKPEDRASIGISDGLMRLSVGIEGADDLIRDLERALAAL